VSHLVIYDADGREQYERFIAIDEAVALVERLRNEGNPTARLFRLEEIQFEVKAYYRVEVGVPPAPAVPVPEEPAFEMSPPPVDHAEPELEPEPEPMTVVDATAEEVEESSGPGATRTTRGAAPDEYAVSTSLGGARRGLFGR
jgi:hypothetical protein